MLVQESILLYKNKLETKIKKSYRVSCSTD